MPLNTSGKISLLRVHDRGTAYGPPTDRIDVEVVMQFVGRPADAFGFQLRDDANGPARQGMLDLLRDAFNHGWTANIDFDIPAGEAQRHHHPHLDHQARGLNARSGGRRFGGVGYRIQEDEGCIQEEEH